MPKISTYTATTPALDDKLLGTDINGTPTNATKNFTVESIKDLILEKETLVMTATSTGDQILSAADTKTQVSFGAFQQNAYARMESTGTLWILTAGVYKITAYLNSGCGATSMGDTHVDYFYGAFLNGSPIRSTVQNTVYFDAFDFDPAQTIPIEFVVTAAANDIIQIYQAASVFVPSGPSLMLSGLVEKATGTTGMLAVPAANLYLSKL